MSFIVVTVKEQGTFRKAREDQTPFTEQQCQQMADKANAKAEEMGLTTRYEVKEVSDGEV